MTQPKINLNVSIALLIAGFSTTSIVGCASHKQTSEIDPVARENAIFACKAQQQAEKKARFLKLPKLLQRLAGDNQILKESAKPLSKYDIRRGIAKFPLAGDSGGTWGTAREAHLRTVSTRFMTKRKDSADPDSISMVFGQPGRVYVFPIANLKPIADGGLDGTFNGDRLRIRIIDEHHVLVSATSKSGSMPTGFFANAQHALIRTYLEQSFNEESATQLPDYPVDSAVLSEEVCEQQSEAASSF